MFAEFLPVPGLYLDKRQGNVTPIVVNLIDHVVFLRFADR